MDIMKNKSKVCIFGGTGYTGVELIRLLVNHPHVEIYQITSRKDKGKRVDETYPSFRGILNNIGKIVVARKINQSMQSRPYLIIVYTSMTVENDNLI